MGGRRPDPFGLYRGSRLTIAQDWASGPGRKAQLSESERTYLKASVDQRRREEQAEPSRRTRRMRTVVGALVILLIVAVFVVGGIVLQQYHTALLRRNSRWPRRLARSPLNIE